MHATISYTLYPSTQVPPFQYYVPGCRNKNVLTSEGDCTASFRQHADGDSSGRLPDARCMLRTAIACIIVASDVHTRHLAMCKLVGAVVRVKVNHSDIQ